MRRKWGKGYTIIRNMSMPKEVPRKWGRGFRFFRNVAVTKPTPRRWGKRKWLPTIGVAQATHSKTATQWTSTEPRKRLKRKHLWLIALVILIFLVIQSLIYFDRELRGPLMFFAKVKLTQMATDAINTAITEEIAQSADSEKLIQWKTDADGKMIGLVIDYKQQMSITSRTIQVVNRVLKEKEELPEKIPLGHALNSTFLSSFGPSVSVKLYPASAVKVDVQTRTKDAGINMLLVEVFIHIRTEIAIVIPFDQEPQILDTEIPLSFVMVVGNVPTYYYDSNGNPTGQSASQAPVITLPAPSEFVVQ
ncbi:MAG: sporulation protein YunB [Candidatus Cohnella colombiensis]|uniref:Sporulation protein YunB n=1 Tax=Candidatus Cohnella colombiensis TaxID=3121368 RepID=A0AA95JF78_9BACL|nr:MAG: sporulation protein YunB [Cohnella sp.]